jgi:thiosulfate reductase cytochrome b subunit
MGGLALAGVLGLAVLHGLGRMLTRRATTGALAVTPGVYPASVRRTHWLNALLFAVLGFTGLSVRFQGAGWALGLEAATRVHQACAALLAVNFLAYAVLAVRSGDIRQYLPVGKGWGGRMARQAGYYLAGIFRGAPHPFPVTPENRFNPLQQAAYLVVFLLGLPLLMLSGLLLVLPESVTAGIAPRQFLVAAHYAFVLGFALFAVGHVYLATTGARVSSLVRGMINGDHEHWKEDGRASSGEGGDKPKA